MDKSKIPTTKFTLSNGFELDIYDFFTQSEEAKQLIILSGNQELNVDSSGTDEFKMRVTPERIQDLVKFKVESLCVNLKWDDFDVMSPKLRKEVLDNIEVVLSKKN